MPPRRRNRNQPRMVQASRAANALTRSSVVPQIRSNIELTHRYRFISTSSTATAITAQSLLGAAGSMCNATNAFAVSVFGSVKVNNVSIWSPPAAQGSSVTCSVEWITTPAQGNNREVSDTSVSTAVPAHVSTGPPLHSLASFWQNSSSNALFTLTAPAGSIIDVSLSLIMWDDDEPQDAIAIANGTSGNMYYLSLDPNATHRYTPVSLVTTT